VTRQQETGRPVLIGTTSVQMSERVAKEVSSGTSSMYIDYMIVYMYKR
jgi:preprotein translocase subunit SecA